MDNLRQFQGPLGPHAEMATEQAVAGLCSGFRHPYQR